MANELVPRSFTPEVVDDEGNKVVGPELDAVLKLTIEMAQVAQLARIRKSLEREHVEGKIDDRTLNATDHLQWLDLINTYPNTPWATAYFFNDGPNPVYIAVNEMSDRVIPLNRRETDRLDFTKADRRIEIIYYWTNPGNTATVRAKGKY